MIEVREATQQESDTWLQDWRGRLQSWYGKHDVTADWVKGQVEQRLVGRSRAAAAPTFVLTADGTEVGLLATAMRKEGGRPTAVINDIWVAPAHRRHGHGAAALSWAQGWAAEQGAAWVWAVTDPAEVAHAALFANYPIRGQQMIKRMGPLDPLPAGLVGRPMTEAEFPAWRADAVRGYAANIAGSGVLSPADAAASSAAQFDELLPDGLATKDHTFLCLQAGAETVATNWISHHRAPGMSWVYGVEVSEQHRGKGYGRAAMLVGEQATLDAGDTHLALNVFGQNAVAISLYDKMRYHAYDHGRSIDL